jgi:hypothetical protein
LETELSSLRKRRARAFRVIDHSAAEMQQFADDELAPLNSAMALVESDARS